MFDTATLKKSVNLDVEIELTGEEIAELFWGLGVKAQSEFFNTLGEKERLVFQLQAISEAPELNGNGLHAMCRIGHYSQQSMDRK